MGQIRLLIIALLLPASLFAGGSPTDDELKMKFRKIVESMRKKVGEQAYHLIQEEALARLEEGDFDAFDPLVADTSCQLRALLCVLVRNPRALDQDMRDWVTLVYVLGNALVTPRGSDGFNIHCQQGINSIEKLCVFLEKFSAKLSKTFLNDIKKAVAAGSVLFARREARLIECALGADVRDLFENQCCMDAGRPVVSCTGICYLLLERARTCRIPLVFRLRLAPDTVGPSFGTITAALVANDRGEFQLVNPRALLDNPRVVVIEGTLPAFNDRIVAPSPEEVEAYLAQLDFEREIIMDHNLHPQYAGEVRNALLENTQGNDIAANWLLIRQRFDDETLGRDERGRITRNDPRNVILDHIYAGRLDNIARYNPFNPIAQADGVVNLRNAVYFPATTELVPNRLVTAALAVAIAWTALANSRGTK